MKEKEGKEVAAFFELLDEWSRAEDAELFMRMRMLPLFGGGKRSVFGFINTGWGKVCGGACGFGFPFT